MQKSFPLKEVAERFKASFPGMLDAMGNDAVNFVLDNFKKQGFQGAGFQPWAKRKNNKYRKGAAILIKSGRLRRSWRTTKNVSALNTKISTDVPYARIHNEGGEINHPARKQVLHFNKKGFSKVSRAKFAQKVNVGAHITKMPQRQMIGNSPVLTKQVRQTLEQHFTKVINNFKI